MKTLKIFLVLLIMQAFLSVSTNAQSKIQYFSYTTDWSLDPAEFDLPCLTEKISGTIEVSGFQRFYENESGTWHLIYHERIEGVLTGLGEHQGTYEVSAFANQEWGGINDNGNHVMMNMGYQWPVTIRHDGKLLLRTWMQYHGTWSQGMDLPVVDRFIARSRCF